LRQNLKAVLGILHEHPNKTCCVSSLKEVTARNLLEVMSFSKAPSQKFPFFYAKTPGLTLRFALESQHFRRIKRKSSRHEPCGTDEGILENASRFRGNNSQNTKMSARETTSDPKFNGRFMYPIQRYNRWRMDRVRSRTLIYLPFGRE